jgi:two-component system invasion response regulator UvrY
MIRILLADDHAVVRTGFRMLLEADPKFSVVAEVESGEDACRVYQELKPDIVVMDLAMPGMGGLEAVKRLRAWDPAVRVLALSAHDDPMYARRMLDAGTLGFLSKRSAPEVLLDAIAQIAAGRRYLDAATARELALSGLSNGSSLLDRLTEREFDVFLRLSRGESVQRIAKDLNLSTSTVGTHLYRVKQKLEAGNQAELTLIAIRHKLIEA